MKRSGDEDSEEEKPRQRARLEPEEVKQEEEDDASMDDRKPKAAEDAPKIANKASSYVASIIAKAQTKTDSTEDPTQEPPKAPSSPRTDTKIQEEEEDLAAPASPDSTEDPTEESPKEPSAPPADTKIKEVEELPTAAAAAPAKLSYPKPKNFAERLMNALERDIASESVWWVGEGKAIALHPNNLKKCPELTEYFKAKDYSGFIRNCNRWGFRRVGHYSVDPGIVTYENSLFQKEQPHLVKHMRMDSDVQDVFARHQEGGDGGASGLGKAAKIIADARSLKGPSRSKRKGRQQGDESMSSLVTALNQSDKINPDLAAALTRHLTGSGQSTPDVEAALAALKDSGGGQQQQSMDESTLSKEFMLRKILQLTDQFLEHPGSLYSDDASFTTAMHLVHALGKQHNQELQSKGHMGTILRLEAALQPKAPPTPMPAQTPAPASFLPPMAVGPGLSSLTGSSPMGHLLGRPNPSPNAAAMNHLQALLMGNQGVAPVRQQHIPPQSLQHHRGPAAGLMLNLLSGQRQQQEQKIDREYMAAATAAAPPYQAADPQAAGEGDPADRGDTPQFTTAQELLMRVMNQNRPR